MPSKQEPSVPPKQCGERQPAPQPRHWEAECRVNSAADGSPSGSSKGFCGGIFRSPLPGRRVAAATISRNRCVISSSPRDQMLFLRTAPSPRRWRWSRSCGGSHRTVGRTDALGWLAAACQHFSSCAWKPPRPSAARWRAPGLRPVAAKQHPVRVISPARAVRARQGRGPGAKRVKRVGVGPHAPGNKADRVARVINQLTMDASPTR